ncbi:hypothetical protein KKC32_01230 [Patescibacteria group bacterium]|nr:hypothetical protein [Patescibacteria group bacterium]
MAPKDGGIELLSEEHFSQTNPWGKPVVGWKPTSQGVDGLHNPSGWALLRGVLWKLLNGEKTSLYDSPMIVENPGAIVIAEIDGRIGLSRNYRMIGERLLPKAAADYIRELESQKLWQALFATLGKWSWEAPRGLFNDPDAKKEEDLAAFILKTAKAEALEEAGFTLTEARIVGKINANTTFFAHSQWVVHGKIKSMGEAKPENLEIIGNSQLFTLEELKRLNRLGEFEDGLTLAAMALCGLSL